MAAKDARVHNLLFLFFLSSLVGGCDDEWKAQPDGPEVDTSWDGVTEGGGLRCRRLSARGSRGVPATIACDKGEAMTMVHCRDSDSRAVYRATFEPGKPDTPICGGTRTIAGICCAVVPVVLEGQEQ